MSALIPYEDLLLQVQSGQYSAGEAGQTAIFYLGTNPDSGQQNWEIAQECQDVYSNDSYWINSTEVRQNIQQAIDANNEAGTAYDEATSALD